MNNLLFKICLLDRIVVENWFQLISSVQTRKYESQRYRTINKTKKSTRSFISKQTGLIYLYCDAYRLTKGRRISRGNKSSWPFLWFPRAEFSARRCAGLKYGWAKESHRMDAVPFRAVAMRVSRFRARTGSRVYIVSHRFRGISQ